MAKKRDDDDRREREDSTDMDFGPKAKTPLLTVVLIFLNIAAALGFTFLLVMDYSKRQAWSYAVFKHDLGLMGLPLAEEERDPSASRVVLPRQELDADQLRKAFSDRPQTKGGEAFQPVTLKLSNPIMPQHLTPEILNDWFRKNDWYVDVGEPVPTLEKEVERLQKSLLGETGEIAKAADAVITAAGAKNETDRRALLERLLLPLAYTPQQIDALAKKIKQEPAGKLDSRIKDAAQRRILVAILTPLERQRPAEFKDRRLEQAVDYDVVTLDRLQKLLEDRMQSTLEKNYLPALHFGGQEWDGKTRDTIEKRNAIAFLVTTVAHTRLPDGKLLQPNGPQRAQVVLGLYEYAYSVQRLTATLIADFERVLDAIRADRDGSLVLKNAKVEKRNQGFVDQYRAEVRKIQELVAAIDKRQKRLDDLQEQLGDHEKIVASREKVVKEVTDKLLKARAESFKKIEEVRGLQKEFFDATKKLIDAQEQNLRREKELRHWEGLNKKGGAKS